MSAHALYFGGFSIPKKLTPCEYANLGQYSIINQSG